MGDYRDDYWKLAEAEGRFNQLQAGLRTVASTWVLAALAGLAFLLRDNETWKLHPALLVWLIAILTIFGLALLWVMDQFVYQRLLAAPFLCGLLLEEAHSDLPPTRLLMFSGTSGGMSRHLRLYYFAPIVVFWLLSIAALAAEVAGAFSAYLPWAVRAALGGGSLAVLVALFRLSRLSEEVGTRALAGSVPVDALSQALANDRVLIAVHAAVEALAKKEPTAGPV